MTGKMIDIFIYKLVLVPQKEKYIFTSIKESLFKQRYELKNTSSKLQHQTIRDKTKKYIVLNNL